MEPTSPVELPTVEESLTVALWPTAAQAIGAGRDTAYRVLAVRGQLCDGVPIIRVGGKWRVPTAPLRRALGLDPPAT